MKEPTLQDVVAARLMLGREGDGDAMQPVGFSAALPVFSSSRVELDTEDLRRIAERHRGLGSEEGYRQGHGHGRELGVKEGRGKQLDVAVAVCAAVAARVGDLAEALGVQEGREGGKDKRTRSELRAEAVAGLERLEAELAVVAARVSEGSF